MAITLNENNITAKIIYTGEDAFELTAGKELKIESTGVEHYLDIVPDGKSWSVTVFLKIEETDA